MKKINIMNEHLKGIHPDDNFDDHITKPLLRKVNSLFDPACVCHKTRLTAQLISVAFLYLPVTLHYYYFC